MADDEPAAKRPKPDEDPESDDEVGMGGAQEEGAAREGARGGRDA